MVSIFKKGHNQNVFTDFLMHLKQKLTNHPKYSFYIFMGEWVKCLDERQALCSMP